jgi:hypothetical protein
VTGRHPSLAPISDRGLADARVFSKSGASRPTHRRRIQMSGPAIETPRPSMTSCFYNESTSTPSLAAWVKRRPLPDRYVRQI